MSPWPLTALLALLAGADGGTLAPAAPPPPDAPAPVLEPQRATGCRPERDKRGRIRRSEAVKDAFKRAHPCPATGKAGGACPGWVVDHVWPLCAGGCDVPANMQWQRRAESVRKDRMEWRMCRERADDP